MSLETGGSAPGLGEGTPHSGAARATPEPPRASGMPLLTLVRPLAGVSIAAMLLGRALGPSALGIGVGMPRLSAGIEVAGNVLSQIFAMLASVILIAEVVAVTRSKAALPLRLGSIALGGFVVIVNVTAAVLAVSAISGALIGVSAAVLALVAAWDGFRVPFARPAAAVVGLAGASSLLRLVSVAVAVIGNRPGKLAIGVGVARGLATAALVLDGAAIAAATTWITSRSRRLATPATVVALLVAFVVTRQVIRIDPEDVGALALLTRRGIERLLTRPEPVFPFSIRVFVAVLAPLVAIAALFARGRVPALSGAVALALVVRSSTEMPLGAVCMMIASLSLVLAAHDDRGMWAMIAGGSAPPEDPDRPRSAPDPARQAAGTAEAERTDRTP